MAPAGQAATSVKAGELGPRLAVKFAKTCTDGLLSSEPEGGIVMFELGMNPPSVGSMLRAMIGHESSEAVEATRPCASSSRAVQSEGDVPTSRGRRARVPVRLNSGDTDDEGDEGDAEGDEALPEWMRATLRNAGAEDWGEEVPSGPRGSQPASREPRRVVDSRGANGRGAGEPSPARFGPSDRDDNGF